MEERLFRWREGCLDGGRLLRWKEGYLVWKRIALINLHLHSFRLCWLKCDIMPTLLSLSSSERGKRIVSYHWGWNASK